MSWIGAAIESKVVMTGASFQSEKDACRKIPEHRNPAIMNAPYNENFRS